MSVLQIGMHVFFISCIIILAPVASYISVVYIYTPDTSRSNKRAHTYSTSLSSIASSFLVISLDQWRGRGGLPLRAACCSSSCCPGSSSRWPPWPSSAAATRSVTRTAGRPEARTLATSSACRTASTGSRRRHFRPTATTPASYASAASWRLQVIYSEAT